MGTFDVVSSDGTRIVGWRNDAPADAIPVVISNGLGTPPTAWPTIADPDCGFRVVTWYYRGTGGGDRPTDESRVRVEDHVEDLIALMDHEGIDRALIACWSLGVNVAFEFARAHPDRVAGIMAVAGVPGGTFRAMFGLLRVPRRFRHALGLRAARLGRRIGPQLTWTAAHIPLNRLTASVINHSGMVLPSATPDRLIPALEEFREHDFRWYFTLAVAAAEHEPMDLSFIQVPVTLVAGRYDVLTSMHDMVEAATQIPHAEVHVLPGSHFLPLEFPDQLADELRRLAERARPDHAIT
ncbi:MAG TPA: alpha/beta hydrolase [Mycobacteriales bacterium]|nr:alpha/beta hydrolase [Mycobacteriales bacterium]